MSCGWIARVLSIWRHCIQSSARLHATYNLWGLSFLIRFCHVRLLQQMLTWIAFRIHNLRISVAYVNGILWRLYSTRLEAAQQICSWMQGISRWDTLLASRDIAGLPCTMPTICGSVECMESVDGVT